MSYGIICLNCRLYVWGTDGWRCRCDEPKYSDNGKTEISRERAEELHELYKKFDSGRA